MPRGVDGRGVGEVSLRLLLDLLDGHLAEEPELALPETERALALWLAIRTPTLYSTICSLWGPEYEHWLQCRC